MAFDTNRYTKSPFIHGEDLEDGERVVVTIKDAREAEFPDGKVVPVLDFLELDQSLTLNKTRVKRLVELLGEDTDSWIGARISIYQVPVTYQGKTMPGVAIGKAPARAVKSKPTVDDDVVYAAPAKRKPQPVAVVEDEEEAPF